ncbi:MAG: alanine racemase [Melioribacter sp.]|uniref:alanine racemase n=1 Tax=Melioribacter sp. TaxID=2052167 RepID=UPI003BD2D806
MENHPVISLDDVIRPTHLVVDLKIIKENFRRIKEAVKPSKVMPILKANAYGHGLIKIAQTLEKEGADYLGVAFLEEGILLRQQGIKTPILVLGGIWGNQIPTFLKYNLTMTASSIDKARQIDSEARKQNTIAKVHLKIDTGMERIGVHYYNAPKFFDEAVKLKNIGIEGIYSHFANADICNTDYTKLQFDRFMQSLDYFERLDYAPVIRHISNSGGILQLPEANLDMVRPGIMLYGVYPSQEIKRTIEVKPALTWKSLVIYFKVIKAGHPVGYGSKWIGEKDVRAVTVPVGYGDGYMRRMSGKARVIINEKKYPVIGTISMDQIVVNIDCDSAYNGDEVILIGKQGKSEITVEDLARWAETIPYEILTNINTRVPRIYID